MRGSDGEFGPETLEQGLSSAREQLYYSPTMLTARVLRPIGGTCLESHVQLHGETYGIRSDWVDAARAEAHRAASSPADPVVSELFGEAEVVDGPLERLVYSAIIF